MTMCDYRRNDVCTERIGGPAARCVTVLHSSVVPSDGLR